MRVQHINVGAMQPYGGVLFDGQTPGFGPATLTCHCLVLEGQAGLVLVDTGTVSRHAEAAERRLDPLIRAMDRPRMDAAEAAVNQLRALGHDPAFVKHIVMTHLDFDHAAGLVDFPDARVHLSEAEAAAATEASGPKARRRYRRAQWGDQGRWVTYEAFGEDWFGLQATKLDGVPGLRLIWLPGHTRGHCGVAVELGGTWLLHVGDAVLNMRELDPEHPTTPTGARFFQWVMETNQIQRRRSLAALRRLAREAGQRVQIVCTHDPAFFANEPETGGSRRARPG